MSPRSALLALAMLVAGVGWAAPAYASVSAEGSGVAGACSAGHGVTVVVEPAALGGSPEVSCDPQGGGRTAARIFADAGHRLGLVSSSPEFVCSVDREPADASCAQVPAASAYWSLWWSDGTTPWTYASLGVDGLTVPDGGSVAFTWVSGTSDGTPRTALGGSGPSATPETAAAPAKPLQHTDDDGGLPGWVAPVVVVVVLGAAGGVVLARRRSRT